MMRIKNFAPVFLCVGLAWGSIALAQKLQPLETNQIQTVPLRVDGEATQKLTVGEAFTLEADLSSAAKDNPENAWTLETPGSERWLKAGTVLVDQKSLGPPDQRKNRILFRAIATKSGSISIPPILLREEGGRHRIQTNEIHLNIGSNLSDPQEKPNWIASPIIFGGWDMVKILSMLFVLVLLTMGSFYLFRRLTRKPNAALSAYEKTLQEIAAVEKAWNASQLDGKGFSFALSATLRRYLGAVYTTNLSDTTDRELLVRLGELNLPSARLTALENSLRSIEAVRYGTGELSLDLGKGTLQSFRNLIENQEQDRRREQEAKAKK